ncbi:alkaline phosphatase family protein [Acidiferrimicrobium sp. IK]|uniref:alkaline phosphatase family protein n=1 Tax=Acidiferrimicrobium sp. IK TaxID=2871700 RepID=UPI0021CAFC9C|nr:alkaline phosphatase family protein [Acidiferrimicrobium sp. IK]MCU4183660.1 alkaline phosphatase family protein [Acidiferrimicrobium sp. IK]
MATARNGAPPPTLPAYGGPCLSGIVPALLAPPGGRPGWVPAPAGRAAQTVLFVVDGLGWNQLQTRRHLAPTLASMVGAPVTSVAPTTTATALASIALGVPPAAHGMVGYRLVVDGPTGKEVMNVLRWRTVSGDARSFVPPLEFQTEEAFNGRPVPVVSKADFGGSGFSVAHLRGSRLVGWGVASSIAVEVGRQVAAGEALTYAYYEGIDKIAHMRGLGEEYDAELVAVDRIVADILAVLPPEATLLVTADHGQVEVGDGAQVMAEELLDAAEMVSGEARFRWLHARPGQAEDLLATTRRLYGHQAWVLPVEQVIGDGWFGGPLDKRARARIGDVALVPWEPVGYLEPADGDHRLVCRHGSLTDDEVLVPLLAAPGRRRSAG